MAYNPVSGAAIQYSNSNGENASDYWLKFYIANTTTPLSMATDSTGATLLAKCKLNDEGYPISNENDNDTIFIPHVDQSYRWVTYRTEAEADANDTASAQVNIPAVNSLVGSATPIVEYIDSVEDLSGLVGTADGQQISVGEYNAGSNVGNFNATYRTDLARTVHDGVRYHSPARDLATEGLTAYLTASTDADLGVWENKDARTVIKTEYAGALNDETLAIDQEPALQAALNITGSIDLGNLKVAVSGLSKTTGNMVITSSTGDGILRVLTNTNVWDDLPISCDGCDRFELLDFELQNPEGSTTGAAQGLVRVLNCPSVSINLSKVLTAGGYTVYLENSQVVRIKGIDMTRGTLWFGGDSGSRNPEIMCSDVLVTGCTFTSSRFDSIKAVALNIKITGNTFDGGDADAIDTYASGENVTITDNYIKNHTQFGIQCKTVLRDSPYSGGSSDQDGYNRHVIISNNIFEDQPAFGLAIKHDDLRAAPSEDRTQYPWDYIVTGNMFRACDVGFYIKGASDITLSSNNFYDCDTYGIQVSNYGYEIILDGNNISHSSGIGTGIQITEATTGFPSDTRNINVCGNIVKGHDFGLVVNGSDLSLKDNRFVDCIDTGIVITTSYDLDVTGNVIRNCPTGILINQFERSNISHNSVRYCTTNGWSINATTAAKSDGSIWVGNLSESNTADSISVFDNTNLIQSANTFAL